MAVSLPEGASSVQVPGYRDRFGDRMVVPQPSGVLLEYLHFADPLAGEPFFARALKERVARLATFSHPSYCRVRRVQPAADPGGRPALVSVHVAGRRLAEVLETASRAGIPIPVPAIMAAARQAMVAVALLHDFAPDGYHGALGPGRLILAGDGRIVVTEHVLGGIVTQAAQAWGPDRLRRELDVATLGSPSLAWDGRRNDIVQMGLIVLAMLLGRPIAPHEYPDEIPWLVRQVPETAADGTRAPLGPMLGDWLERALSLAGDSSYATLVDSQDALAALMRDERYAPSQAAWDSFVAVCETARSSLPPAAPSPDAPKAEAVEEARPKAPASIDFAAEIGLSDAASSLAAWVADLPTWTPRESPSSADLDTVESAVAPSPETRSSNALPADALPAAPVAALELAGPAMTPDGPPSGLRTDADLLHPVPADAEDARDEAAASPGAEADSWQSWTAPADVDRPRRRRRVRIDLSAFVRPALVLALLVAVGAAAAVYAPKVWAIVFDDQRTMGQLKVESDPAGSSVTVDGLFVGVTPVVLRLRQGSHQLEVQNGGALQAMTVQVKAGQRTAEQLAFPGVQDRGGLSISTYPATGRVTVDGVPRGRAPVKIAGLLPGVHVVAVETPLGPQSQDVVVEAGKLLPVQVQTVSWAMVQAPYDLEVTENGKKLGMTGRSAVVLSPGRHYLEFTNSSVGLKLRQMVDTRPGELTTVPLDLPKGTLNVTADQPAEVSVDGEVIGGAPVSGYALPLGPHQVVVQNANGRSVFDVTVTLASPVRLSASFKK